MRPRSAAYAPLPDVDTAEAIGHAPTSAQRSRHGRRQPGRSVHRVTPGRDGPSERLAQAAAETAPARVRSPPRPHAAAQTRAPWTRAAASASASVVRLKPRDGNSWFLPPVQQEAGRLLLRCRVRVHLVNPSDVSFGTAVITPRWLYVLAAATPARFGDPAHRRRNARAVRSRPASTEGDVVGIGIHTGNALRGYAIGQLARARGAFVVFGGIHATLFPDEAREHGAAHAVVKGDGDLIWPKVARRLRRRARRSRSTTGGRIEGDAFLPARWDLLPSDATCGPRCRRCAAARSTARSARCGGPTARSRASATSDAVVREIVELRREGFRFIALADDNFYPVTLADLAQARAARRQVAAHDAEGTSAQERFELMARLARAAGRHGVLHADHHGSRRGSRIPRRR